MSKCVRRREFVSSIDYSQQIKKKIKQKSFSKFVNFSCDYGYLTIFFLVQFNGYLM